MHTNDQILRIIRPEIPGDSSVAVAVSMPWKHFLLQSPPELAATENIKPDTRITWFLGVL